MSITPVIQQQLSEQNERWYKTPLFK